MILSSDISDKSGISYKSGKRDKSNNQNKSDKRDKNDLIAAQLMTHHQGHVRSPDNNT